jgi:phosphoglycolate phosphatase
VDLAASGGPRRVPRTSPRPADLARDLADLAATHHRTAARPAMPVGGACQDAVVTVRTRAVIWDWNGTLLDDVEPARRTMNTVLAEFGAPTVADRATYRSLFGFPIRDFYARLGLDVSPGGQFEPAADRYLELFETAVLEASLQPNAREAVHAVRGLGVQQVLISATVEPMLHRQLAPHGVQAWFDEIHGITDAYAPSKMAAVTGWLAASGLDPRDVLMVGDTDHDEAIAVELGVPFVAYGCGHQARRPGRRTAAIDDLALLPRML